MTTMNSLSSIVGNVCGCCKHTNTSGELFCAGCGQTMVEPCPTCSKPVALTQKYCGGCGTDLAALLQNRIDQYGEMIGEAVQAAKAFAFDRSDTLLARVAELSDYRFAKEANQAHAAIAKIAKLKAQSSDQYDQLARQAMDDFRRGNRMSVVKLLGNFPANLLSDESREILKISQAHVQQVAELETEVRKAVAAKQWVAAGGLLDQLLDLVPGHPGFTKLAGELSQKLLEISDIYLAKSKYAVALQYVSAVPIVCQNERSARLRAKIENIHWSAHQIAGEPYALPLMGRLCVRLAKESPQDEAAKAMLSRLSESVRSRPSEPRLAYADWDGNRRSWIGGKAGILAYPQSFSFGEANFDRKMLARHSVAFGLALQGLTIARVDGDFMPAKKGLMSSIRSRKKPTKSWGVDMGAAGIRAIELELMPDGRVEVLSIYSAEFNAPTCRVGSDTGASSIRDAIRTMVTEMEVGDTPVWISLPTNETVNRFVRLPPVNRKQAEKLLDVEVSQRIPLPSNELAIVRWISEDVSDVTKGRLAFASAVRRTAIESRVALCQSAGLTVSGIQSAAIALVNFAAFEFDSQWRNGHCREDDENSEDAANDPHQGVAVLDSGAEILTVAVITADEFWFSSIENAGENFTVLLARATKKTSGDAESLKRDPSKLVSPSTAWGPLEIRMTEIRARLEQTMREADKVLGGTQVTQVWCVGGSAFTFGWIRRVVLSE